jgi:hypothetical protein
MARKTHKQTSTYPPLSLLQTISKWIFKINKIKMHKINFLRNTFSDSQCHSVTTAATTYGSLKPLNWIRDKEFMFATVSLKSRILYKDIAMESPKNKLIILCMKKIWKNKSNPFCKLHKMIKIKVIPKII